MILDTLSNYSNWLLGVVVLLFIIGISWPLFRRQENTTDERSPTKRTDQFITKRYLFAISIIALLSMTTYLGLNYLIKSQESSSTVINMSGRQRMLSQKIALTALKLQLATRDDKAGLSLQLNQLVNEMRTAHQILTKGSPQQKIPPPESVDILRLYFGQSEKLDEQVQNYLNTADKLLARDIKQSPVDTTILNQLLTQSAVLLPLLNRAVAEYEAEAKHKVQTLRLFELFVLLATLTTLLLECLYIFRPMSDHISRLYHQNEQQKNILNTFIKSSPLALAMFDKQFNYINASDRWIEEIGIQKGDLLTLNFQDSHPLKINNIMNTEELRQRAFSGESILIEIQTSHSEYNRGKWYRMGARAWYNNDKTPGGLVIYLEDISKIKEVEILKNEFIAIMNHELRTPLTSIKGAIQILKVSAIDKLSAKEKEFLQISESNCARLGLLINDILDIEKMAAGKLPYHYEAVEINQTVKEVMRENQGYAEKFSVSFALDFEDKPLYSMLDKHRFNQALTNLLSNACKFSRENQAIQVQVKQQDEQSIDISVIDQGTGIPSKFHAKIFEKFAQANSSSTREKEGTGLGLFITKTIIEQMGGNISFESQENIGTTFTINLPLLPSHPEHSTKVH